MTMMEIMKDRLPDGLEIVKVKEMADKSRIRFMYDGVEATGSLPKTCAPGKEACVADFTINVVMMEVHMKKGDLEGARFWLAKQSELAVE